MKIKFPAAALLAGIVPAGCIYDDNYPAASQSNQPAAYPSVDDIFISSLEWRFVAP